MPVKNGLLVGLAQIAPVWFNKKKIIEKVCLYIETTTGKNYKIIAFGKAFITGYPFWIELTNSTKFNLKI